MRGFTKIVVGYFMIAFCIVILMTGYDYYDMNRPFIEPNPAHLDYVNEYYPYAGPINFTMSLINTRAIFEMNGSRYTLKFYNAGSVSEKVVNAKDYWG